MTSWGKINRLLSDADPDTESEFFEMVATLQRAELNILIDDINMHASTATPTEFTLLMTWMGAVVYQIYQICQGESEQRGDILDRIIAELKDAYQHENYEMTLDNIRILVGEGPYEREPDTAQELARWMEENGEDGLGHVKSWR
jgi:hypothetical protein